MSIPEIMYKLILGPLELLFDVIFSLTYEEVMNAGLSLIVLSLAVNLLILPLYKRADAIQEEERDQMARMKPGIDKIKRVFKGDEQYLILKTYYRQNHYKPLYALRSALPLLLQVPFFMAAYNYLSNLTMLQGLSFGPIPDLGRPDGMLQIGGWTVNVLPVAMTLINIVSGAVYTRGMPLKNKLQLYGMALLFLVLLYDSPAGLVFYWTLNNVFSLGKNVIQKAPDPRKLGRILWAAAGTVFLLFFEIVRPVPGARMKILFTLAGLMMLLPLARSFLPKKEKAPADEKTTRRIFFAACMFLTILTGLLIPSAIVNDSVGEFYNALDSRPPAICILDSSLMAAGTFLIWAGIFYRLSSGKARQGFGLGFAFAAAAAMIDYSFFGLQYGNLSPCLIYDYMIRIGLKDMLINAGAILLACSILFLLWKKKQDFLKILFYAGCLSVLCMSVINISGIISTTAKIQSAGRQSDKSESPSFTLDKKGKNVVVFMIDRAISGFVPYIFSEKPELAAQFEGFTYYPNTLSYGAYTNAATPSLFGGYEYTPLEINRKTGQTLQEKQNEALRLMPVTFMNHGYDVTVCDPPYANYSWTPDLSIFDDYPSIHAFNTMGSVGAQDPERTENRTRIVRRNLFCYSLFRCSPPVIHLEVYDKGRYNDAAVKWADQAVVYIASDTDRSNGMKDDFLEAYYVMESLPALTRISDNGSDHFMMIANDMTHDVQMLQMPDYVPESAVDNSPYENADHSRATQDGKVMIIRSVQQMEHYHANMSAFLRLGRWLDYLRENGLYDNTRIIIVSDHGRSMGLAHIIMDGTGEDYLPADDKKDPMLYNPVLLVKDFGSAAFTTDNAFMTNADVPAIAFSGLIEDPVNPFTGNRITSDAKESNEQYPMYMDFRLGGAGATGFSDPFRITLRNHYLFDPANWSYEQ